MKHNKIKDLKEMNEFCKNFNENDWIGKDNEITNKLALYLEKLHIFNISKSIYKTAEEKININVLKHNFETFIKKFNMSKELNKKFHGDCEKMLDYLKSLEKKHYHFWNKKQRIEDIIFPNLKKDAKKIKSSKMKGYHNNLKTNDLNECKKEEEKEESICSIFEDLEEIKKFKNINKCTCTKECKDITNKFKTSEYFVTNNKNEKEKQLSLNEIKNEYLNSLQKELFCLMQRYSLRKLKFKFNYNKIESSLKILHRNNGILFRSIQNKNYNYEKEDEKCIHEFTYDNNNDKKNDEKNDEKN